MTSTVARTCMCVVFSRHVRRVPRKHACHMTECWCRCRSLKTQGQTRTRSRGSVSSTTVPLQLCAVSGHQLVQANKLTKGMLFQRPLWTAPQRGATYHHGEEATKPHPDRNPTWNESQFRTSLQKPFKWLCKVCRKPESARHLTEFCANVSTRQAYGQLLYTTSTYDML